MSSLASRGGECGGIPLPSRLGGLGEHRELPRVRGGAPAENEIGALESCQKAAGGNHFSYPEVHVFHGFQRHNQI